jgi:hypothetical protein
MEDYIIGTWLSVTGLASGWLGRIKLVTVLKCFQMSV